MQLTLHPQSYHYAQSMYTLIVCNVILAPLSCLTVLNKSDMTKLPKFPLGAAMLVAGSSRLTSTLAQHIQITPRTLVARLEQEDGTESQNEKNWSIWAMIAIAAGK